MSLPRRRIPRTSVELTSLGFGASLIGNLYRAVDDDTARATSDDDTAPASARPRRHRRRPAPGSDQASTVQSCDPPS